MKKALLPLIGLTLVLLSPRPLFAAEEMTSIRIKTNFNIWNLNLKKEELTRPYSKFSWNGFDVKLPTNLDTSLKDKTMGILKSTDSVSVNYEAVAKYLERVASPELNRDPQDVTISTDEHGKVKFEGFAFNGQKIDYQRAFYAIRKAIQDGIDEVRLPLQVIPATVNVLSDDLKQKGIAQLISTGESNFKNSPNNRRVNIKVGLSAFNGRLIAPGAKDSAGAILGRVDGTTGYLKELVIKGDETIPEYGGGLCQVSTTIYRGFLIGGFPITERRNHSYAVSYYDPQGLDAAIYPPNPDLRFVNDTPNHILIQTTIVGDKAYSNVYGTADDRQVDLIGPYYYAYTGIPPPRVKYTDKLAPGEKKKLGDAHGGFKSSWYRRIAYSDPTQKEKLEHIFSSYESRPLYTLIGAAAGTAGDADLGSALVAP